MTSYNFAVKGTEGGLKDGLSSYTAEDAVLSFGMRCIAFDILFFSF